MFASSTAWICSCEPAMMFEMVQQASLRTAFFSLRSSTCRLGSAPALMTACVCRSSPVTMLPTVRSAGVLTATCGCVSSSTTRRMTPASSTAARRSWSPSERYESAQSASVSTSLSCAWISAASVGSASRTLAKSGTGLPRQKFESVQVALRMKPSLASGTSRRSSGASAPESSTRSRATVPSPAMLPSAHTACSRTSSLSESSRRTKCGTAPAAMTACVCSVVPEAMFVSAQAASNCRRGFGS